MLMSLSVVPLVVASGKPEPAHDPFGAIGCNSMVKLLDALVSLLTLPNMPRPFLVES